MNLSSEARSVIGLILITIPTIEFGGYFLLSLLRGRPVRTPIQMSYYRAGHAHAGVLVILAILAQLLVDAANLASPLDWLVRAGFFLAPILVSAGFFLGAPDESTTQPGRLISLIYVGAVLLAGSAVVLGAALAFGGSV